MFQRNPHSSKIFLALQFASVTAVFLALAGCEKEPSAKVAIDPYVEKNVSLVRSGSSNRYVGNLVFNRTLHSVTRSQQCDREVCGYEQVGEWKRRIVRYEQRYITRTRTEYRNELRTGLRPESQIRYRTERQTKYRIDKVTKYRTEERTNYRVENQCHDEEKCEVKKVCDPVKDPSAADTAPVCHEEKACRKIQRCENVKVPFKETVQVPYTEEVRVPYVENVQVAYTVIVQVPFSEIVAVPYEVPYSETVSEPVYEDFWETRNDPKYCNANCREVEQPKTRTVQLSSPITLTLTNAKSASFPLIQKLIVGFRTNARFHQVLARPPSEAVRQLLHGVSASHQTLLLMKAKGLRLKAGDPLKLPANFQPGNPIVLEAKLEKADGALYSILGSVLGIPALQGDQDE